MKVLGIDIGGTKCALTVASVEQENVEFHDFLMSVILDMKCETSLIFKTANKLFKHSPDKGLVIPDVVIDKMIISQRCVFFNIF